MSSMIEGPDVHDQGDSKAELQDWSLGRLLSIDHHVVGSLGDADGLSEAVLELCPDVIVLDVNLPKVDGLTACRQIMEQSPDTKVIVFTAVEDPDLDPSVAAADLDPTSGQARLSYRRAAELFDEYTGGWTLHQLRHSALTHAAEAGANTSTLLAYSGHTSVTSLARYARVSPEALARWQTSRDPMTRRH